ncbi:mid1-interacting protein 1-like [Glandiceps talaboti]
MDIQLSDREKIPDKSILGMMKRFIEAVNEMDSTVMIPSRLIDMKLNTEDKPMNTEKNGNVDNSLVPTNVSNRDLYTYFSLLRTIKIDLVKGTMDGAPDAESSEEEDSEHSEQARQAAGLFREHLRGLFNVLDQLTEMAKCLTSKYQQETGDFQTCPKPKSFTV